MVARAHDRVQETNDPTAHAVVVALREAARKLGAVRLADATIFATQEPCAMCVGALLESDVEALVFAVREHARRRRRDRHPARPAPGPAAADQVVSGIRRDEAEAPVRARRRSLSRARTGPPAGRSAGVLWYPLPRRGVRVVDGAALEKRCAKAPRVRIPPSPPSRSAPGRPMRALAPAVLAHALRVRSLRSSAPPSPWTPRGARACQHGSPPVAADSAHDAPAGRCVDVLRGEVA